MAVIAVFGKASGLMSGMRIKRPRIAALKVNVPIIQYLDLVLILPPDSINESSNITSLAKKSYSFIDTEPFSFVPEDPRFPEIIYALTRLPVGRAADLPRLARQSW
jgi:hypothetical protein